MDLQGIEKNSTNIKKYVEMLNSYYQDIIFSLKNLYAVVVKYDVVLAHRINDLINRYNEMMKTGTQAYMDSVSHMLDYVECSNQNLSDLEYGVFNSTKILNDTLANLNNIE